MQWNTDITTTRIDCAAADLIDELCRNSLPEPCNCCPEDVWQWLCSRYVIDKIPQSEPSYAKTALAVLETNYPDEAEYLPYDAEECLSAVKNYYSVMNLHCGIVANEGAGAALYDEQKREFEQRAGKFGLIWKPLPITVSMDFNSGYRLVNGSQILSDMLRVKCGVNQKDIDERSPELLAYLRAKSALDNLNIEI